MVISIYHWVWYLLGFISCPRLTIMIGLSLYAKTLNIPLSLMILGWILALMPRITIKK